MIAIEVKASGVDEITECTIPSEVVADLAALKGRDIKKRESNDDALIVASDTIVVIDEEILGKPKDRKHAREILTKLSGREHEVFTAVYMGLGKIEKTFVVCSEVKFTNISSEIMDLYLEGDEALDKAGAYGIQGQGLLFVEKLTGSYSNVVGFPLTDFIREMKLFLDEAGYDSTNWRNIF